MGEFGLHSHFSLPKPIITRGENWTLEKYRIYSQLVENYSLMIQVTRFDKIY